MIRLVHKLVESGASSNDIIVALANEKERLFQRIIELELIAPKRISTPLDDASHLKTVAATTATLSPKPN